MSNAQFVDISSWNDASIDWQAYKTWSAAGDGISRVCMRSSYGNGYTDSNFARYRTEALAAGIDAIIYYHYAYPQFNSAVVEADYQRRVVGPIRNNDIIMLDFEEFNDNATGQWAIDWLRRQEFNYNGKLPCIYSFVNLIQNKLQDSAITRYPLFLANWTFNINNRPACPPPWKRYALLQYTDKAASVPGIKGTVDGDIYIGELSMTTVPTGWTDNGKELMSPPSNGRPAIKIVSGFRDYVLSHNWSPLNLPLEEEYSVTLTDESDVHSGPGMIQDFMFTKLAWSASSGVGVMPAVQELEFVRKQRDALIQQIIMLKAGLPMSDIKTGLVALQKIIDDMNGLLVK